MARSADDLLALNLTKSGGGGPKVDADAVAAWGPLFRKASEANINYFDALVLDDLARDEGIRTEDLKDEFAANDFDYSIATWGASADSTQWLEQNVGKGPSLPYAQLGFSLMSYVSSSSLLAQYYSLDAELDDDQQRDRFRPRAGRDRDARRRVRPRPRADRRRRQGRPRHSLPTLLFQNARVAREGGPSDKMSALRNFWTASTLARLMTLLGAKG